MEMKLRPKSKIDEGLRISKGIIALYRMPIKGTRLALCLKGSSMLIAAVIEADKSLTSQKLHDKMINDDDGWMKIKLVHCP